MRFLNCLAGLILVVGCTGVPEPEPTDGDDPAEGGGTGGSTETPGAPDMPDSGMDPDPVTGTGGTAVSPDPEPDASMGDPDPAPDPVLPQQGFIMSTSGGGRGTSTTYGMQLSIGGPQPHGSGASNTYKLSLGVPHAP